MVGTDRAIDIEMTCCRDGRSHRVCPADHETGLTAARGHYSALCGHDIMAAALSAAPGPPCPACRAQARSATVSRRRAAPVARRQMWIAHRWRGRPYCPRTGRPS